MFKAILILLCAMFSIQFGASLAKGLFPALGPIGTSSLRLIFAAIMLSLIFKPWKTKISKSLLLYGSALGIMNLTFYLALERIPLGIAVSLEFLGPLIISLMGRRSWMDYVWTLLAGLGIFFIFPQEVGASLDLIGVFWALMAAFCWALYIVFGSEVSQKYEGGTAASWGMIIAALVVIPFGLIFSHEKIFNFSIYPIGILVAFLSSALPYTLEMFSMKKIPRKTFGILMSLEPVCACLIGILVLNEDLTLTQYFAIACIMAASIGATLKRREGA